MNYLLKSFIKNTQLNNTLRSVAEYLIGERTATFCTQNEELAYLSLATTFPISISDMLKQSIIRIENTGNNTPEERWLLYPRTEES